MKSLSQLIIFLTIFFLIFYNFMPITILKKIIQNDNDLKYFIRIIIYGCEIRPFQIAIYAHLCTLIHLYSQKSKNQQFINFKKILKEYLFKNRLKGIFCNKTGQKGSKRRLFPHFYCIYFCKSMVYTFI